MSEKLIIPQVLTSPMPWGVKVEWKWPEGSHWFSKLEMQYLHSDGRLEKQVIGWPVTGKAIGGLKAGERLQIRLRPIDKNGAGREWTQGDWIEGVSSSNAEEYLAAFSITPASLSSRSWISRRRAISATRRGSPSFTVTLMPRHNRVNWIRRSAMRRCYRGTSPAGRKVISVPFSRAGSCHYWNGRLCSGISTAGGW